MTAVRALLAPLLVGVVVVGAVSACVAPVRWSGAAKPPDDHLFVGRHGRPLAYGGGVCPVEARHLHRYPPVPAAAFVTDGDAARDTRAIFPYFDAHPHHRRTCFIARLHYHLEPPRPELGYSSERDAFVADGGTALEVFAGAHAPRACDARPCTFTAPHGHRPCP